MSINFVPLSDRVLIKLEATNEKSSGGIIIPESAKEKPMKGTIAAVGEGSINQGNGDIIPIPVKIGQTVFFGKWSGTEIELDTNSKEKYIILKITDILGYEK